MAEADSIKPTKECATCGEPFTPRQYNQKYCCCACKDSTKATCLTCGVDYHTTRNSLGKYCSVGCSLEQTHAARRLARREKEDAWRERNQGKTCRVSIKPCICCEQDLVGPRPTQAWASKFCQACKDALGNAIGSNVGRVEFLKARLHGRKCDVCETLFTPYQETSTVCSIDCRRQTEEFKEEKRAYKARRRAMKKTNGPYGSIRPVDIFERDKWTCYICGIDTPAELRGSCDDAAPEMDHIIPLAAGGTHTEDNVACACRKCNQEKSDRIIPAAIEMRRALAWK